jgi:hypothetical protein
MKSIWRKSLQNSSLYISAWVFGYGVMIVIFGHSPSRQAYGLLSGWWCALYVSYILSVNLRAAAFALLVYFCFGFLSVYFGWSWLYHDLPHAVSVTCTFVLLVGGLVFVSPILLNSIVRFFLKRQKNL